MTQPKPSEITPPQIYARRREFLKIAAGSLAATGALLGSEARAQAKTLGLQKIDNAAKSVLSTREGPTAYTHVVSYNNYYEFGTDKADPARNAGKLRTRPWAVVVDGEVAKPRTFAVEQGDARKREAEQHEVQGHAEHRARRADDDRSCEKDLVHSFYPGSLVYRPLWPGRSPRGGPALDGSRAARQMNGGVIKLWSHKGE